MIDEGSLNVERLTLLYALSQAFNSLMTLDELLPSIITQDERNPAGRKLCPPPPR